jgi:hypothetical protein
MGCGWSTPRPGRFTSWKETRFPLYRRLGGPRAGLHVCGKSRAHRNSILNACLSVRHKVSLRLQVFVIDKFTVCIGTQFGNGRYLYICTVHTVLLFESLVAAYCQTQHVKYWQGHTTSATCFGSHCSLLQALRKRSNKHWSLHLGVRDTYCLRLLLKYWL